MTNRRQLLTLLAGIPGLALVASALNKAQGAEVPNPADLEEPTFHEWDDQWDFPDLEGSPFLWVHRIHVNAKEGWAPVLFQHSGNRRILLPGFEVDEQGRILGDEERGRLSIPALMADVIKQYQQVGFEDRPGGSGFPKHRTYLTVRHPDGKVSHHLSASHIQLGLANMLVIAPARDLV